MIKLTAIGNIGKDAEVRDVNGRTVISFNIAHTERFTSGGATQEKTVWVSCSYWTDKTNIAQYLKKGTQVYVEGIPDVNLYVNKENKSVASLTLKILNAGGIQLLGSKSSNASAPAPSSANAESSAAAMPMDDVAIQDDLPF